jgi:peptidoglycan/xylan/chitin deacetylase (PgdA/CDA1 family)
MRALIPIEYGGYYPGDDKSKGADGSGSTGSGGIKLNPNIDIPRTVPPGSAIRYSSASTSSPLVALTFDDGPHPSHTPRLLDILARRNVKATFFVVGSRVQSYPHIVARMIREGHEVANHTWSHPDLTKLSDEQTRSELQRTAHAIFEASGIYPRTYRPPYGAITERHCRWIHSEFGYPTVLWNVDPKDWQKPGPSVVSSRLVAGARKGAILLAHDIHAGTVSAIPSTLDQLLARGYRFVTVTQLINTATFGSPASAGQSAEEDGLAGGAPPVNAVGDGGDDVTSKTELELLPQSLQVDTATEDAGFDVQGIVVDPAQSEQIVPVVEQLDLIVPGADGNTGFQLPEGQSGF